MCRSARYWTNSAPAAKDPSCRMASWLMSASARGRRGRVSLLGRDLPGSGQQPRRPQAEEEPADVGEEGDPATVGRGAEQPEISLDELVTAGLPASKHLILQTAPAAAALAAESRREPPGSR